MSIYKQGIVDSVVIKSGSYTGNSSANRAIPHGLGATPKIVLLVGNAVHFTILQSGRICYGATDRVDDLAVTAADATNFYVGNATSYDHSANLNTIDYYWVAIR